MSKDRLIKCKCCNHLSSLRDIYESNYRCWNCASEIELIQECDAEDKFVREIEQLKVEMAGSQERAEMLLRAKDEWADRARAAEAERDALVVKINKLNAHISEWLCDKCRTVHPAPDGFDLSCKTSGCDGFLRPSSANLRQVELERDALRAEVESLKSQRVDWQAQCLKRGFDYVRESDDHYVLADIPEMAALLGELLGVEVRSKENNSYGETVSELREQLESANAAFHRAYELEKENDGLRKDAEIGRVARRIASELHDSPKSALSQLARAIDAAMAAEGGDQ